MSNWKYAQVVPTVAWRSAMTIPRELGLVKDSSFDVETIYFNNIVGTKNELLKSWLIPVKDSWLAKRIKQPTSKNI